jgi:ribosomal protein L12E/L44/L45/RPP1/RPP2
LQDGDWEAPLIDNPECKIGCGEWKRPMIVNPAYKGKWKPPKIDNPAYKGIWVPRQLPNPDYFEEKNPRDQLAPMAAIAVEVWTTNGGIFFDNFAVGHNIRELWAFADATYGLKEAVETRKAEREKQEKEREKKKKERDAKLKKKGGATLQEKVQMKVEEIAEFLVDHAFMALGTAFALFLGFALTVISILNNKKERKVQAKANAKAAAAAAAASKGKDEKDEDNDADEGDDEDEEEEEEDTRKKNGKKK